MGKDSNIEWTDHTFNPWWGCSHVSPACDNCYAEALARRMGYAKAWESPKYYRHFGDWNNKHWREPLLWDRAAYREGRKALVFCGSMCDVLDDQADPGERNKLWGLVQGTPNLIWLILTKRSQNFHDRAIFPWAGKSCPENLWPGVTAENEPQWLKRVEHLVEVEAAVRWVSCEPLLGPIDRVKLDLTDCMKHGVDWIIAGGESGAEARMVHPHWVKSLRDQCAGVGVPFLFKQWGEWKPISDMPESEYSKFYVSNRLAKKHENQSELDHVYGRRCTVPTGAIRFDGEQFENAGSAESFGTIDGHSSFETFRVGKKNAGCLLDGREWKQFPPEAGR